ncbi:MAG: endonuclease MutS2 [Lachnospiraceae bacterium]|nr:endonuclease MutS2 [Lachnospiraceae bacterium]
MNEKAYRVLEFNKIINILEGYAASPLGKEYCRQLVPFDNIDDINEALANTSDAVNRVVRKGSISFAGVKDIRPSLARLKVGSYLGAGELLRIAHLLEAAQKIKTYGSRENVEEPADSLDEMFGFLEPMVLLCNEIKRCIISEEEINDEASPGLSKVRRQMRSANDKIHSQMSSLLNSSRNYLQDAVITIRNGRYCLPVKSEYKGMVNGMVHDQSSSGSTFFIEPMSVVKLNNELRELEIAEQREIEAVLAALSSQAAAHTEGLEENFYILSKLDFIFAKAALSKHFKCSAPVFNTKGYINIKDGRHPLLDPKKAVPINIYLGKDFDLLIVTGPNTGGKTVSLKTVGLFTLMGQAGLHIPAFDGSQLAVFTEVFADIGDEQSIEQSLSTFSSHMTNIVSILEKADKDSLVLFDELCAGTDPTEGAALAMSILTFLHNMQVRTMATTHYSELKVFALSTEGVENACCEFDVASLMPTYRLLIGIPGRSNAFAISKKLGLPDYIIDDAKKQIGIQETAFEELISDLNESRQKLEREQAEITAYRNEIASLKSELSAKHEKLNAQRERLLNEAHEEARRILAEAKENADKAIRNINRISEDSGVSRALEEERKKLREQLEKADSQASGLRAAAPKKKLSAASLHIGDKVRVLSLNLTGTVSTLPNAKGDLFVQMGILRSQVNISDLEPVDEAVITGPAGSINTTKQKHNASSIKAGKSYTISPEINLIGMTTDEAMPVLDKYLDDAYLAHLSQVRIIHGRGTGTLKNAVHRMLKKMPHIEEYRLGVFGEGDSGVTIVTFKNSKGADKQ